MLELRIFLKTAILCLALSAPVVLEGPNLVQNSLFRPQSYHPDPETHYSEISDDEVKPWRNSRNHMLTISTWKDFKKIKSSHQLPSNDTTVCLLSSKKRAQISQNIRLQGGQYQFEIDVAAIFVRQECQRTILFVNITSQTQHKQSNFGVATEEQVMTIKQIFTLSSGEYKLLLSIEKQYQTVVLLAMTNVKLTKIQKLVVSQDPKEYQNMIQNEDFKEPEIPPTQALIEVTGFEVPKWQIQRKGYIVRCLVFNPHFRFTRGFMFARTGFQTATLTQSFKAPRQRFCILTFNYGLTSLEKSAGFFTVFFNNRQILEVLTSRLSYNKFYELYEQVRCIKDINQVRFEGKGFMQHNTGLMLTNVIVTMKNTALGISLDLEEAKIGSVRDYLQRNKVNDSQDHRGQTAFKDSFH